MNKWMYLYRSVGFEGSIIDFHLGKTGTKKDAPRHPSKKIKSLNNIIDQDYKLIKKRLSTMLDLQSFRTAKAIIYGGEAMHMIKKKQVYQKVQSFQRHIPSFIIYLE
ncbi:DDE-type integrase/transposase/recombinase [Priestia megaterium]